jgi:hypothetical protein
VLSDALGASVGFTAALTSSPPAGATVLLSFVGLSPALAVSVGAVAPALLTAASSAAAPTIAFTTANWRAGVPFSISTAPGSATLAVGSALPVTLSAPGWGNASATLAFVRLAALAPRTFAPASVIQGGDAAAATLMLPPAPPGLSLTLTIWLDVSKAPLASLTQSVTLVHIESPGSPPTVVPYSPWQFVVTVQGGSAPQNATALLAFSMESPFASSGETVRVCAQLVDPALRVVLQAPSCSSPPTTLLDSHVAAIGGVTAQSLADGTGSAWLVDNTTLRLVEGQITALSLGVNADAAGSIAVSASELRLNASAPSFVSVVTAVGYIRGGGARVVQLLVRGAAPVSGSPPFDSSDTSRRGQIILRAQAISVAGAPFDSGFASAKSKVLDFVLVSSGASGPVITVVPPTISVSAPPLAQLVKGATQATPIAVSLAPYPAAGRSVSVLVSLPAGVVAVAPGPLASTATGLVALIFEGASPVAGMPPPLPATLFVQAPSDGVAGEARAYKTIAFSIDAGPTTTDQLFFAVRAVSLVLPAIDATQPQLVLGGGAAAAAAAAAPLALTEGGAVVNFSVALSVGMLPGASVTVTVSAASGACQQHF